MNCQSYISDTCKQIDIKRIKISLLVFHRARHKKEKLHIEINQVPIEQVRHTQFLDVVFDDYLD